MEMLKYSLEWLYACSLTAISGEVAAVCQPRRGLGNRHAWHRLRKTCRQKRGGFVQARSNLDRCVRLALDLFCALNGESGSFRTKTFIT